MLNSFFFAVTTKKCLNKNGRGTHWKKKKDCFNSLNAVKLEMSVKSLLLNQLGLFLSWALKILNTWCVLSIPFPPLIISLLDTFSKSD